MGLIQCGLAGAWLHVAGSRYQATVVSLPNERAQSTLIWFSLTI